jgi:Leucine-rich repeat (LRR) protein
MDQNTSTKSCPQCGGEMVKSGSKYKCKFCGHKESAAKDKEAKTKKAVTSISIGGIVISVILSVGGRYARQMIRDIRWQEPTTSQEALADFTYTPNLEGMPTFDYDSIAHSEDGVISSPTLTALLEFMFGEDIWESQGVLTADAAALAAEVKYLSFYGNRLDQELIVYYGFEDYHAYPEEDSIYGNDFRNTLSGISMSDISYFSDYKDFLFAELDCFPNVTLLEANSLILSTNMQMPALTALCYDAELSEVIKSGLPISQLEALRLDSPSSLEGIEAFESLTFMEFSGEDLTSLDRIDSLPVLESLILYDYPLSDLSPLGNIPSLEALYLFGGEQVKDLSFLAQLPDLSVLWLEDTAVLNLDFLSASTSLYALSLTGNGQLNDFSVLGELSELKSLYLDISALNGDQPDLSVIGRLANLDTLRLADVYDVSFIQELNGLTFLSIDTAIDTSIVTSISHMANLEILDVINCGESSLEQIELLGELSNLSELYVENMELSGDMTGLFELPGLSYLSVANCRFYEPLSPIDWPSTLTGLDISGVTFFDITESYGGFYTAGNENKLALQSFLSMLGECTSLQYLNASECIIEDTSFLGNLTSLQNLNLMNCDIEEFAPDSLSRCSGLQYLDISGNTITSIEDLSQMKDLSLLYMENNYVTDLTPLVFCEALYYVNIANNPVETNPLPENIVDTQLPE